MFGSEQLDLILASEHSANFISTGILLIAVLIVRSIALRSLQRWHNLSGELRRRWIVLIRNVAFVVFAFGLVFIWATELKAFAVSIVAFAVALVIATKEMLLCFLGGLVRYGGKLFEIGDRIEVDGIRGDVISHSLLTTVVFELGPGKEMHQFTGRMVTLPNVVFLSSPVFNETTTGRFTLHVFRIPFPREHDWRPDADRILDAARDVCKSYIDDARHQYQQIARREGLEIPKLDPRVQVQYVDEKRVDVVVRMPVPARAKGRIEQAVLMRYADYQAGDLAIE